MGKYFNANVEVSERGTIAVMEWIRDNGCPDLDMTTFTHKNQPFLIVSNDSGCAFRTAKGDVDNGYMKIFEYNGLKRITGAMPGSWYFNINNHYYFATAW